ncbi:hypothetical protein DVR12_02560 [Chitinophaga silvatica]|uniref:Uncharacterized protein n=1 Tax=Chitinophaga silvatica TaxID=2282649 RepID=A0A3E1YH28_9BACT|nr:hypothetical protein DVR12_02560 [Chitinophaga silvatica]
MGFLNTKTAWANKEFIPFKLCIASIYVIVGSYFHSFFENYYIPLFILFGITVTWTLYLWIKKMKQRN